MLLCTKYWSDVSTPHENLPMHSPSPREEMTLEYQNFALSVSLLP